MNRQQTIARRSLTVAPRQLSQLHFSDDVFGDEFDWDETTCQFEGESQACDMLGFLKEFGAE